jgi:hypothetical protein
MFSCIIGSPCGMYACSQHIRTHRETPRLPRFRSTPRNLRRKPSIQKIRTHSRPHSATSETATSCDGLTHGSFMRSPDIAPPLTPSLGTVEPPGDGATLEIRCASASRKGTYSYSSFCWRRNKHALVQFIVGHHVKEAVLLGIQLLELVLIVLNPFRLGAASGVVCLVERVRDGGGQVLGYLDCIHPRPGQIE